MPMHRPTTPSLKRELAGHRRHAVRCSPRQILGVAVDEANEVLDAAARAPALRASASSCPTR